MKKIRLLLILLIVLTFQACGLIFSKCGKSVEIGEFLVLQESIDRWFSDSLNLPTIYVKEHIGILAFRDSNRTVWLKES